MAVAVIVTGCDRFWLKNRRVDRNRLEGGTPRRHYCRQVARQEVLYLEKAGPRRHVEIDLVVEVIPRRPLPPSACRFCIIQQSELVLVPAFCVDIHAEVSPNARINLEESDVSPAASVPVWVVPI